MHIDGDMINFETYLISNLLPNDEIDLNSVDVTLDFFDKNWKENWYRIPYYLFDYVSLLNK